eukprot:2215185-Heterocapsa_arctica.AAC.1
MTIETSQLYGQVHKPAAKTLLRKTLKNPTSSRFQDHNDNDDDDDIDIDIYVGHDRDIVNKDIATD